MLRNLLLFTILGLILAACGGAANSTTANSAATNPPEPESQAAPASNISPPAAEPAPAESETNAVQQNEVVDRDYSQYEIITLLPEDAIPAIDNPNFLTATEADSEYAPDELILGVAINGEARAYSVNLLSRHEIVNDTVGGRKIAVTW
jgi:hypothetical protein